MGSGYARHNTSTPVVFDVDSFPPLLPHAGVVGALAGCDPHVAPPLESCDAPLVGVLPSVVGVACVEGSCPPPPVASRSRVVVGAPIHAPKLTIVNVVDAMDQPKLSSTRRCSFSHVARPAA